MMHDDDLGSIVKQGIIQSGLPSSWTSWLDGLVEMMTVYMMSHQCRRSE